MASPVLVPLVANVWTLVATAITNADLQLKRITANSGYLWTYVNTGGAAPVDDSEAIPIRDKFLRIEITPAVDVYVKCTHAGIVRVDVGAGTISATLAGDIEIGAVELKNAVTDDRAEISDANTARGVGSHVLSVQHVDSSGAVLLQATQAAMNGKIPALGTAAMAASSPITLATNDTHFGQVGAVSDVDGNIHGQLRYIGEAIAAVLPVTPVYFFDADGDNTAQVLKNAAGVLYKITAVNPNAADAYVQLFNTAAGGVTPGVTAPVYVVYVPAGGSVIDDYTFGLGFSTAITYVCATTPTGAGDPAIGLTLSAVYK